MGNKESERHDVQTKDKELAHIRAPRERLKHIDYRFNKKYVIHAWYLFHVCYRQVLLLKISLNLLETTAALLLQAPLSTLVGQACRPDCSFLHIRTERMHSFKASNKEHCIFTVKLSWELQYAAESKFISMAGQCMSHLHYPVKVLFLSTHSKATPYQIMQVLLVLS